MVFFTRSMCPREIFPFVRRPPSPCARPVSRRVGSDQCVARGACAGAGARVTGNRGPFAGGLYNNKLHSPQVLHGITHGRSPASETHTQPSCRGEAVAATPPRVAPATQPAPASSLELPPPPTSSWLERSGLGRGNLERGRLRARGDLDVGCAHELLAAAVAGLHLLAHDALLVLVARLGLVHATPGEGERRRQRRRWRARSGGGDGGEGQEGRARGEARRTWMAMCVL